MSIVALQGLSVRWLLPEGHASVAAGCGAMGLNI
jgi:hypothetical protein